MKQKDKKVLVTGGSGFVGSHLVDALVKKGYDVVVIDVRMKWLNPAAKYYKMSVTSPKVCDVLKREKPAYIFHLAAQIEVPKSVADPLYDADVNIIGLLNMLQGCRVMDAHCQKTGYCAHRQLRKFIYFSTGGALYGNKAKPPTPETFPAEPESPYGIAKLTSERYLEFYHRTYGLPYVAVRPANIYGPRQAFGGEAGVIPIFVHRLLKEKAAVIDGSGKQTRDFVYVGDVVRAAIAGMERSCVGPVNVGTGREISVNDLFRLVKKETGSKQPEIHGAPRKVETARSALDIRRARKELGWKPVVSFEDGMKRTVEWMRKET